MLITNILLFLLVVLFGFIVSHRIFVYFKDLKSKYFVSGVQTGTSKTMRAIIDKAKEGKSFNLKDDKDDIKLIMLTKKNAKSIRKK